MKTTTSLILINIGFFVLVMSLAPFLRDNFETFFIDNIALTPSTFSEHPWTLITSMFMHAPGFPIAIFSAHLLVNMMSLFFLGSFLERIIGRRRFLVVYLLGGFLGGLFFLGLASISSDPRVISLSIFARETSIISAVGASAAIFALAGCLAILVPKIPVLVFFFLPMKLYQAVIFLMVVLASLPGIANSAHLGGAVAGVLYGLYLRKKYKRKVVLLNKMLGLG